MTFMFHFLRCVSILLVALLVMVTLSALPASAGTQVPFKASLALVSQPATNNAGCPTNTTRFNATGPRIASHMGEVTVSEFVCLNVDLTFVAYFTLTAANGDQLTASAAGYGVPTSQTISFASEGGPEETGALRTASANRCTDSAESRSIPLSVRLGCLPSDVRPFACSRP